MSDAASRIPPAPALPQQEAAPPPAPPEAPRPLTPHARRRAWMEPAVRFWWQVLLALLAVALYVAITQGIEWWRVGRLFSQGRLVQATLQQANGTATRGQKAALGSSVLLLAILDGEETTLSGSWDSDVPAAVGETVQIRVGNSGDLASWTAKTQPPSVARHAVGLLVLLPPILLVGLVVLLRRRRVLRTWHDGQPLLAVVIDARQTALAPRSAAIRCTPCLTADRRIFTVHLPHRLGRWRRGDLLWLLVPASRHSRCAVAAAAFVSTVAPTAPTSAIA